MQVRRNLGNCFFQASSQRHRVAAGHGEEQFEILSVAQGGQQRRLGGGRAGLEAGGAADGDGWAQQFGPRPARAPGYAANPPPNRR